jgi:hypothetical protein
MHLVVLQSEHLAELYYLMADPLASCERDLLKSFQSSLAVYIDVYLFPL